MKRYLYYIFVRIPSLLIGFPAYCFVKGTISLLDGINKVWIFCRYYSMKKVYEQVKSKSIHTLYFNPVNNTSFHKTVQKVYKGAMMYPGIGTFGSIQSKFEPLFNRKRPPTDRRIRQHLLELWEKRKENYTEEANEFVDALDKEAVKKLKKLFPNKTAAKEAYEKQKAHIDKQFSSLESETYHLEQLQKAALAFNGQKVGFFEQVRKIVSDRHTGEWDFHKCENNCLYLKTRNEVWLTHTIDEKLKTLNFGRYILQLQFDFNDPKVITRHKLLPFENNIFHNGYYHTYAWAHGGLCIGDQRMNFVKAIKNGDLISCLKHIHSVLNYYAGGQVYECSFNQFMDAHYRVQNPVDGVALGYPIAPNMKWIQDPKIQTEKNYIGLQTGEIPEFTKTGKGSGKFFKDPPNNVMVGELQQADVAARRPIHMHADID